MEQAMEGLRRRLGGRPGQPQQEGRPPRLPAPAIGVLQGFQRPELLMDDEGGNDQAAPAPHHQQQQLLQAAVRENNHHHDNEQHRHGGNNHHHHDNNTQRPHKDKDAAAVPASSSSATGGLVGGEAAASRHHRRHRSSGELSESDVAEDDMCCFDWALLCEPVTLFCGHTFCRHCVSILLDDAATKGHSPEGSMRCPLCCRALPAVLPEPNVRLRNDLRARYPRLYESRLAAVRQEFGPEGCAKSSSRRAQGHALTAEDLREMLAHRRRVRRQQQEQGGDDGEALLGGDEGARGAGGAEAEEDEDDLLLEEVEDPVLETVELFQAQLLYIWRRRRGWCWALAAVVLLLGFTPLRQAEAVSRAEHVEAILRVESWRQWWGLGRLSTHDTCGLDRLLAPSSSSEHHQHGPTSMAAAALPPLPGSELLSTVLMYPSWGWVERLARGLEGTVLDLYRVATHPTPATLLSAFPGLAMAAYALCQPGWSALFREAIAFLAIEGEVRQLMALLTILTIPTRIPRDPRDIPPLPQMPVYAWTVLSLSLAQGAYLLVCNMVASLLDMAAVAPLVLGLSHGMYWRSEASLAALLATRVWFMLREDLGLFRHWLGSKPRAPVEATAVRLLMGLCVLLTHMWGYSRGLSMYNSSDLVSTLANAGDAIVHEIFEEMEKASATGASSPIVAMA